MNKSDPNDLAFASRFLPKDVKIISENPAPFRKGKAHFNFSEFSLSNGERFWISHCKPIYYINQLQEIRPLSEVLSYHGNRFMTLRVGWEKFMDFGYLSWLAKRQQILGGALFLPMSKVPMFVNAFGGPYFPDPDPETTSVDGYVFVSGQDAVWGTVRSAAGSGSSDVAAVLYAQANASATNNQFALISRSPILFDTSAIPDTDTISSATVSLFGNDKQDQMSMSVGIATCNPASNTALVNADYNIANWTMTAQNSSDMTIAAASLVDYNDFSLNTTGISNISKTSITKFGYVLVQDRDNVAPTWSSSASGFLGMKSADTVGTDKDPKLSGVSSFLGGTNKMTLLGVS